MKLYNDQRNEQILIYLSIYFCLTCFGLSFSPSSEAGVQLRQWFKSPGYGVSARALRWSLHNFRWFFLLNVLTKDGGKTPSIRRAPGSFFFVVRCPGREANN
jgi:hypothetical protein